MITQRTRAIASRSSLHEARIEFFARSTSSKEAPSDKPSSFSAFSTDISNGAESSARDPARRTVVDNERREGAETALHHRRWPFAAVIVMPIWAVSGSRARTVVVVPPAQRMARAGKVVAICCVGWELRGLVTLLSLFCCVDEKYKKLLILLMSGIGVPYKGRHLLIIYRSMGSRLCWSNLVRTILERKEK